MKKKHQIKDISDIKYCEEHGLRIYSEVEDVYYEYKNNVWCGFCETDNELSYYQCGLNITTELYYYEEQEQKEADENDVGKLCWFWNAYDAHDKTVGLLKGIEISGDSFYADNIAYYRHCRPFTKAEIQEFMEKAE